MKRGTRQTAVTALLTSVVVVSACSSDASSEGGDEAAGEDIRIVHAVSGQPALEALPGLYALDQLREKYGYDVEIIEAPETSIIMEGVSSGEFTMGGGASAAAMNAISNGAELTIVAMESGMQWLMAASPGIEDCADLGGKRVGLHAAGSAGEGYFNFWVSENCTEEERAAMNILYVAGSEARAQALLAGQLDAGMVTVSEVPVVDDDYDVMIDFSEVLGKRVLPNPIYFNNDFLAEHPEVVDQFMDEFVAVQRDLRGDEDLILELMAKYLPPLEDEDAQAVAGAAVDTAIFPEDGGLSVLEGIDEVVDFLITGTGELKESARETAGDFVDLGPLEGALDRAGSN